MTDSTTSAAPDSARRLDQRSERCRDVADRGRPHQKDPVDIDDSQPGRRPIKEIQADYLNASGRLRVLRVVHTSPYLLTRGE